MSNLVVDSGKPAGTCHSGTCTQQGTHRLDWDTWANLTCDEHTASWRPVTSPDGTPVKVTPLFRCACCIADADPEGERETERWTWQPEFRQKVRATPFVNGNGLVGEYRGQYGAKHRVLVTERGPWYLTTIECYREDIHPAPREAKPAKPRTLSRAKHANGYVTSDGRYEVEPVYGSSIRGGDVSRPTSWCLKDHQGEYEPRYRPLLSDIRDILKERP